MLLSSATPEKLPSIKTLHRLTKSLAMLDAIICPEWDSRYYSYNSKWGEKEEMASMRNGCGDDWFLLFDANGAALKGFAYEYPLARDGSFAARIQQLVPSDFTSFLREPAFSMNWATFCLWRRHTDSAWNAVSLPDGSISPERDGSSNMLYILDCEAESYRDWAEAYYEREVSLAAVRAIYEHQPLSNELIANLNSELSLSDINKDVVEIGYPAAPAI